MESNVYLDRLALGYVCHRCRAGVDEPCTTPHDQATKPHSARVNRAVRAYQKAKK